MTNLENREEKIQQLRDAFDYVYLGHLMSDKTDMMSREEAMNVLSDAGIDGFIERYLAIHDKDYPNPSINGLLDLTHLSHKVYENFDKLPVEKRIKVPETSGSYKFIATGISSFLELVESDELDGLETNQIWFSATEAEMHQEIADGIGFKSLREARKIGVINEREIFGGGWIDIDYDKKEIRVRSSSGSFGSCSNALAEWLLEEFEKEGYTVTVDLYQKYIGRL